MMMRAIGRGGSSRCQDCGNQAKRDCAYMRCRTCCKGKGFQCQTHIKSTWVPSSASSYATTQTLLHHHHHHQILPSSAYVHQQSNKKRLRENPPTGLDEEEEMGRNFPAMVRCIRVSSTEYAYQAQVSIEGHVFKGILYDQGLDLDYSVAEPHQPNLSNAHYHHHHQHSHNIILPSSPSSLPFNALMPGMHFFQQSPSSPKSP